MDWIGRLLHGYGSDAAMFTALLLASLSTPVVDRPIVTPGHGGLLGPQPSGQRELRADRAPRFLDAPEAGLVKGHQINVPAGVHVQTTEREQVSPIAMRDVLELVSLLGGQVVRGGMRLRIRRRRQESKETEHAPARTWPSRALGLRLLTRGGWGDTDPVFLQVFHVRMLPLAVLKGLGPAQQGSKQTKVSLLASFCGEESSEEGSFIGNPGVHLTAGSGLLKISGSGDL